MKMGRFRLNIRKRFFTVGVVRYWNQLAREIFKAGLAGALSNLVLLKISLLMAGELELGGF